MKFPGVLAVLTGFLTASLAAGELIEVLEVSKEATADSREVTYVYWYEGKEHSEELHLKPTPLIVTDDVAKVSAGSEPRSFTAELTKEGEKKFAEKTAGLVGKRIAIVVQGKVISAPGLRFALGRNFTIDGFKDEAEVKAFVEAFEKRGK